MMLTIRSRETVISKTGFTLIELLITLAIAAVLIAIAAPSYRTFVLNNRIKGQASELMTALQLARSEAVKRGMRVSVCISSDNANCATSGSWAQGWIVFVDGNTVGTLDGTGANGDKLLRTFGATLGSIKMEAADSGVSSFISFTPSGATTLSARGRIKVCPPSPAAVKGREIEIAVSGRPKVSEPSSACS